MSRLSHVEWHGEVFQRELVKGLDGALTASTEVLRDKMIANTMGIEGGGPFERRVSGRSVVHTNRHGAPRFDSRTGNPLRGWRRLDFGDGVGANLQHFQGDRVRVPDFGGRTLIPGRAYYVGPGAPPGCLPAVRTGRFNSSMGATPSRNLTAYAGSNVPYAKRLEFGFFGTDSLGRTYHQPARPWAMRSTREAAPAMLATFQKAGQAACYEATAAASAHIRGGA